MTFAHRLLKPLRALHLYLGVFCAPALLFLAFTGGMQSVNLHEATRGSDYRPPAWLVAMAHMHKKQTFEVPGKRPAPKPTGTDARAAGSAHATSQAAAIPPPAPRRHNPWPMKCFFVLVSLSLLLSTLTGLYMAWRCARDRRRYGAALAAGIVVPALLMLF